MGWQNTSVSEWKFIIASSFKFTLLRQPGAAGCCPDQWSGQLPAGRKLAAPGGYFYNDIYSGLVLQSPINIKFNYSKE